MEYINIHQWMHDTYDTSVYDTYIYHFLNDRDNRLYFKQCKHLQHVKDLLSFKKKEEVYLHSCLFHYFKEWIRIYVTVQRMIQ